MFMRTKVFFFSPRAAGNTELFADTNEKLFLLQLTPSTALTIQLNKVGKKYLFYHIYIPSFNKKVLKVLYIIKLDNN